MNNKPMSVRDIKEILIEIENDSLPALKNEPCSRSVPTRRALLAGMDSPRGSYKKRFSKSEANLAEQIRIHHEGEAMDIIVVQSEDGSLHSTEFNVNLRHPKLAMKTGYRKMMNALSGQKKSPSKQTEEDSPKPDSPKSKTSFLENMEGYPVQIRVNGEMVNLGMLMDSEARLYFGEGDQKTKDWTTTPSPQQLASLRLQPGKNILRFETMFGDNETRLIFAETWCFLWNVNQKLAVFDIDGTITKTDIGGFVGGTLAPENPSFLHDGICPLMQTINTNYQTEIVFLTARAMPLKKVTRNFLSLAQQNESKIPLGPIFNCPENIVNIIYQEVVTKTMHHFKSGILLNIKDAFRRAGRSESNGLFEAGFGNKPTDAMAYEAVEIKKETIFIIDKYSQIIVWDTKSNEKDGLAQQSYKTYADAKFLRLVQSVFTKDVTRDDSTAETLPYHRCQDTACVVS